MQVPWGEVGAELGKRVVDDADKVGSQLKDELKEILQEHDITSTSWRYELTIWIMFWLWYLANSPRLLDAGATKLLLDAHHRASYESMIRAGLVSLELNALRALEADLEERFTKYKKVFENRPAGPVLFTGTIGWEFCQYVYGGQKPDPRVALLMTMNASFQLQAMVEFLQKLESQYKH